MHFVTAAKSMSACPNRRGTRRTPRAVELAWAPGLELSNTRTLEHGSDGSDGLPDGVTQYADANI